MRVNVGGGADVAVPQPLLDLLHGDAVFEQKGCAAVAQVVQADVPQPLFPQQLAKTVGDIAGFMVYLSYFFGCRVSGEKNDLNQI